MRWFVNRNSEICSGLRFAVTLASLGSIHIPRQRSCDCSSKTRPRLTEKPWFSVRSLIEERALLMGSFEGISALQNFRIGQTTQLGREAQTRAPKSISAELYTPAPRFGSSSLARCHNASRPRLESIGICRLNRRASRRAIFASTTGTVWLKANVTTAFAV